MNTARRIVIDWSQLPQCTATRTNNYANDTPTTDRQCQRKARILYNGRLLCTRHAEVQALTDVIKQTQETELL